MTVGGQESLGRPACTENAASGGWGARLIGSLGWTTRRCDVICRLSSAVWLCLITATPTSRLLGSRQ